MARARTPVAFDLAREQQHKLRAGYFLRPEPKGRHAMAQINEFHPS
jgi:hypothetical protein